jgi:uncharacterized protein
MKFVLLILAVFLLFWMLRGGMRRRGQPPKQKSDPSDAKTAAPQAMLTCAQCGAYLPGDLALPGRGGVFCDSVHRDAFEKAHPDS